MHSGFIQKMDSWKCIPSGGASSVNVLNVNYPNQMDEKAQSIQDVIATGHAVETELDIDIREIYFLIMHFLSAGPCQRTFGQFCDELLENQLLPRRYHAWFSRNAAPSGDDDDDGISFPLNYNNLVERYPHVAKDHLVKLLKQLMLSAAHPLHGRVGRNTPNAADVPTFLGSGSFSLLDFDSKTEGKQVKPLPLYLRWPYMQADQVRGLNLREIGGGFTKHHRAPSIRSACYAIAKPSTMVQKMQNIKKLRGHRDAVYCAIFDRSGRYVITGSDDRLVKIWSMDTAFCLASCRGHEGDITDLAVSSNNVLVASASNDFVIRVWRLPDGLPISVLRGHTGAVTAIAFSPRPSAVYQLLSSSDDGTCRIWDARYSQCNPRIYLPKPSDAITGKSNGPSNNVPSSSNAPQSHQILCCAYNANGTVFVTGSSDTFARVWSAFKSSPDDSNQPIHEIDLLSGHENDVNYVQFSGCSVASKFSVSDSLKEDSIPKFRNSWFSHDNIVTCSRDGSAIIWVPKSRRSHGKVGRWTRAYHLKVPPPPLPPQPPRGGPRQRFLPTPRGVNMIVWSLDNRFVLAAIMDCRICVWNAVDGSLVHSLTGHAESSYVLDVHPFNPRIAMSAGYDGRTIVWDIWEGTPIRIYEIGRFKLVDGKFSPDGTSIVISDDVGQIYLLNTGQGESQNDAKYDQFFLGDYRPLIRDAQGNVLDQETQLAPHRRNIQDPLCDSSMMPYSEPYQSQYQQRRLGALGIEWHPSSIKFAVGTDVSVGQDYQMLPLADLDRIIEPQPEFIDAIYWELENEVISDDTDSEYNVAEENSSEGEKESIHGSSSSYLECSGEDSNVECSNKDALRRSRRKKHNADVELVASSGRRVKKRNLDDCHGTLSGSNRTKKSKSSRKSLKMKSSKSKTLRPQRVAARNARNMFSQFTGTSTDGDDDDDSEDESSDSLQDSNIQSESERNLHNMQFEQPSLDEFANVSKSPAHFEPQVKGENRKRLILKFSLRDSNKHVPSDHTKVAFESETDLLFPSSRPQETTQENIIDGCSMDPGSSFTDAIDLEIPESHRENDFRERLLENASNHLEAYGGDKENTVHWGGVKIRTSKRSKSGDVIPRDSYTGVDATFDDHFEQNANREEENLVTDVLQTLSSVRHKELAHHDIALKESSSLGTHQPKSDASPASGNEQLHDGHKDCSVSNPEDSLERKEIDHSNHPHDVKMKASLNPTKLIISKKRGLSHPKSPCKLRFVTYGERLTSARGDANPVNPSYRESNQVLEVSEEGEDIGKSSVSQLSHPYQDMKIYDDVCQMDKSYDNVADPDGLGGDMEENTSTICNYQGLGINGSKTVNDSLHRTRSVRDKRTSEERNALNLRLRIRGGQSSAQTSKKADPSIEVSGQLPQRTRGTRNQQGGYFDNDPSTFTRRRSNHPVKKLSWLMLSEHEEFYRYIPQLGDEVVYLRQGHLEFIESSHSSEVGPWRSNPGLGAVEVCKVEDLDYATVPGSGDCCCKIKLRFVDPSSSVHGRSFKLTLPELINFPDFVVEKTRYDASMKRNWTHRDKCMVWWRNANGEGGSWWEGRILSLQAKSHEFPDSPWERFVVQYKTDPTESHQHSPWELHDIGIRWDGPHINHDIKDKLMSYFTKFDQAGGRHQDNYGVQALSRAAEKSDFLNRFPVPLYLELIQSRLKNDYYRSLECVKHDIMVALSNAESFFMKNAELLGKIKRLSAWFERKLGKL
ncbi:Bromodomain and WD repeat-containing protein [Quillaja saponaria]|uniref:Bromodomain and WD repeat-containing protein n=1 Tax=Quillaja saponaria TaxID=32244 RepID=A0AAD7QA55_QUISA|nr:Bromodomain and WD repeat-containing protein [Quillaja saponaria]